MPTDAFWDAGSYLAKRHDDQDTEKLHKIAALNYFSHLRYYWSCHKCQLRYCEYLENNSPVQFAKHNLLHDWFIQMKTFMIENIHN